MWQCYLKIEVLDENGEGSGTIVDVVDSTFTLGSDSSLCNIILPHEDVEPVHAHIDVDPENSAWRVFVRTEHPHDDQSSRSKGVRLHRRPAMTILNGFPLWRPQPLHHGDVLSIGPFDLSILGAGVVLHTGERVLLCPENVGEISWPEVDKVIKTECEWFTDTVLHRPPIPLPSSATQDTAVAEEKATDTEDTAMKDSTETATANESTVETAPKTEAPESADAVVTETVVDAPQESQEGGEGGEGGDEPTG